MSGFPGRLSGLQKGLRPRTSTSPGFADPESPEALPVSSSHSGLQALPLFWFSALVSGSEPIELRARYFVRKTIQNHQFSRACQDFLGIIRAQLQSQLDHVLARSPTSIDDVLRGTHLTTRAQRVFGSPKSVQVFRVRTMSSQEMDQSSGRLHIIHIFPVGNGREEPPHSLRPPTCSPLALPLGQDNIPDLLPAVCFHP